jgi:outer membrane protein OmpA-like peptidoglycan-associated protein
MLPERNALLEEARSDYNVAQQDPQNVQLASNEFKQAGEALNKADQSWSNRDDPAKVEHLSYLAKQRVGIAREKAKQKSAEMGVASANAERDKMRLAARTTEVDTAQRQSEESRRQSEASQQQAEAAQRQTAEAQAHAALLEAQLQELNAKKTERGLVITFSDVLFDTNKSALKSTGMPSVEKLANFLKKFPERQARIEGYTDSVGSKTSNLDLSTRRANAVRQALIELGVAGERVGALGFGEEHPVAGNKEPEGRRLNRRVEIILSDETGKMSAR